MLHRSRNDCAVRAITVMFIATQYEHKWDYDYVNKWLHKHKFRKSNESRTKLGAHIAFLKYHKIKYKHYYRNIHYKHEQYGKRNHVQDDKFDGLTVKTFQREKYEGRYCVSVRGHILGVVDGVVMDWTDERQHKILSITQLLFDNY